jgi:hypothetical protein
MKPAAPETRFTMRKRNRNRDGWKAFRVSLSDAEIMADLTYPASTGDRPTLRRGSGRKVVRP